MGQNEAMRGDVESRGHSMQQQILKVKRLDKLIWNSFGAQTQQHFIDSCTDDRSR